MSRMFTFQIYYLSGNQKLLLMEDLKIIRNQLTGIWQVFELGINQEIEIYSNIIENNISFQMTGMDDRDTFYLVKEGVDVKLHRNGSKDVYTIHYVEPGKWMLWSIDSKPYLFYRL
ncbi:MAG: hypothetical protein KA450_14555, partial [Bacteroidia bacterium]|nr:hypothetical protein [Bacteroidia bacterium]